MKLEDILSEWEQDAPIDLRNITQEASRVPSLHAKYLRFLSYERLVLRSLEAELHKLKSDKEDFFLFGPNEETIEKGWEMPPKGRITLKEEIKRLVLADADVSKLALQIANQQEKVSALESIVHHILGRSYAIKNVIDHKKFELGA